MCVCARVRPSSSICLVYLITNNIPFLLFYHLYIQYFTKSFNLSFTISLDLPRGMRISGISVLPARYDDDDDDPLQNITTPPQKKRVS